MALASATVLIAATPTPLLGQQSVEGASFIFVRNDGSAIIACDVYYYPDGVTPVRVNALSDDLSNIAPGEGRLSYFPPDHPPSVSISATAVSGVQSVHVEIIQPPVSRRRTLLVR